MSFGSPQLLLLLCSNCKGMTGKLLPEINMRFSESLRVLPVTCPSQLDPFAVVKLLKKSVDGVIVACPKDACCCPENKKAMKRREIVKDILPVFGLHKEQFQVASVSPFGHQELIEIVDQMLALVRMSSGRTEAYKYLQLQEDVTDVYKWVN